MQPTQLYLDTARLGRMSRRAQHMHLDFTRMAGEEGGSLFFERFLLEGSDFCLEPIPSEFSGLMHWRGIGHLKQDLRTLAGSDPSLPILMVNRSAQLMRFAARLLFQSCRHVLVTDLCWPPYLAILDEESRRTGRPITVLKLRSLLGRAETTTDCVVEYVREQFQNSAADGLLLTAVSHLGEWLPLERIVRTLETVRELRFVVADGAQDFCHVSADVSHEYCDLYLAGCHKWLQGFHPMGLGFYGRKSSSRMIESSLQRLLVTGELDDPLLRFTTQLEFACLDGETETVNLIPLFTCQGAAVDALLRPSSLSAAFEIRQQNLLRAATLANGCGWRSRLPAEPFRTGILLLEAERSATREKQPTALRRAFAGEGVALTAYAAGMVRLSMPSTKWQPSDLAHLQSALEAVA